MTITIVPSTSIKIDTTINTKTGRPKKTYRLKYEDQVFEVTDLKKFCEEQGLSIHSMYQMVSGKRPQCFGITLAD
ncbi:MAG: hypothetical protein ACRDCE_18015 [Cetobacterium sp.]|uniref:hypothetical protein n=1 Tax=Cetobacterium sp. TaxID=2071632 RepID=UPI003EE4C4F7